LFVGPATSCTTVSSAHSSAIATREIAAEDLFPTFEPVAEFRRPPNAHLGQYLGYLQATLAGIEKMRTVSGLILDKVRVRFRGEGTPQLESLNSLTSPTNIALDLILQSEALGRGWGRTESNRAIATTLTALERLEVHRPSGLYFSWYSTDLLEPKSKDVSSVDNIHLALALWSVSELFPGT
jgi:hypothetical protein